MYTRVTVMFLMACVLVLFGSAASAQPTVINGSFEDGAWNSDTANGWKLGSSILGWATNMPTPDAQPEAWGVNQRGGPLAGTTGDTPDGGNFLFIQGNGDVWQDFGAQWEEGYRYDLDFHVNARQGQPAITLEIFVGTKSIYGPVAHSYREGWRQVIVPFRYQAAVMGGTDVRFHVSSTDGNSTLLIDRVSIPYARTVDFQTVQANLHTKLDLLSAGLWTGSIWGSVVDAGKGYQQLGPTFNLADHTGNGINDDLHLGLLEPIVNDDACARALLGDTKMDNIQTAFMLNRNFATTRELTFQAQIQNWTRVSVHLDDIKLSCTLEYRPLWTGVETFTTNANSALSITVDAGGVVGNTSFDTDFDLPSLWGPKSILSETPGTEGLSDDLADLIAAYLTIGDQDKMDYMQHVIAALMQDGFRLNLDVFILDLVAGALGGKSDGKSEAPLGPVYGAGDDKNYTVPVVTNLTLDSWPDLLIEDGDDWYHIHQLRLWVPGAPFSAGIANWVNSYNLGTNGLAPQVVDTLTYGYPTLLRAGGDLNSDGTTNLASAVATGGILLDFQIAEDVAVAQQFLWYNQPSAVSPLDYGSPILFNVFADYDGSGTSYQWYRGTDAGSLVAVPGETSANWFFDTDFYSVGAATRDRYYQVSATTLRCGLPETIWSDVVIVDGALPPVVTVIGANGGGDYLPGAPLSLSVGATCPAGQYFTYQWQKDDGGWADIPGA
ncbi:MAG: hypothetical protein KAH38_07710, partial [Candidatus Hydrogenedentes bacterium]|nr:hypothetical protein [Candidatus Hydrogenedentota bacterium]